MSPIVSNWVESLLLELVKNKLQDISTWLVMNWLQLLLDIIMLHVLDADMSLPYLDMNKVENV